MVPPAVAVCQANPDAVRLYLTASGGLGIAVGKAGISTAADRARRPMYGSGADSVRPRSRPTGHSPGWTLFGSPMDQVAPEAVLTDSAAFGGVARCRKWALRPGKRFPEDVG
jgi:hypothetical protein